MTRKVLAAVTVLTIGCAVSSARANTYTVEAINDPKTWLDTGIVATPGTIYDFTVINPSTLWSAGSNEPFPRTSTADGINPASYGTVTMDGLTANFGALVAEIGSTFDLIGTGPTYLTSVSGDIKVGYWDTDYPDNTGSQTLDITTVPEASTWAMMLAGFALLGIVGFGAAARRPPPDSAVERGTLNGAAWPPFSFGLRLTMRQERARGSRPNCRKALPAPRCARPFRASPIPARFVPVSVPSVP